MRTRLTDVLEIDHPVMLAGMGGVSYSELVAAVSEAGGFGCLGASTMSDDELDAQMADVRARTDKPFGVDLLTAVGDQTEKVERIIAAGATVYVAGLGTCRVVRNSYTDAFEAAGAEPEPALSNATATLT